MKTALEQSLTFWRVILYGVPILAAIVAFIANLKIESIKAQIAAASKSFSDQSAPPLSQAATTSGSNSPIYQAGRDIVVNAPAKEKPEPAYVFLDPAGSLADLTLKVGEPPTGMLQVKNVGKSQAFELVVWRRMAIGPWPLPADFDFPLQKEGQPAKVAQPGEVSYWAMNDRSNPPITQTQFDQLKAGVLRFYIYGRIEYNDPLGNQRWTNFCLAVVPPTDPHQAAGFGLQRVPRHNESDKIGR